MMDRTENASKKVEKSKEHKETSGLTRDQDLDFVVGGANFDFVCRVCGCALSRCICGKREGKS